MKLLIAFQEPLKNALNEGINNYFPQVDREDFQTPYIKHTGDTQSSLRCGVAIILNCMHKGNAIKFFREVLWPSQGRVEVVYIKNSQ